MASQFQNVKWIAHGANSTVTRLRLSMVKVMTRLRLTVPTAAQVSPLKRPSFGVR